MATARFSGARGATDSNISHNNRVQQKAMGAQVSSAPQVQQSAAQSGRSASAQSLGSKTAAMSADNREIIALLMPLFYIKAPLLPSELEEATRVWKIIVKNQSKHFAELKTANPNLQPKLVSEYLHLVFYNRLFEVHPGCRGMFNRALNKMNLLPMISLVLSKLDDEPSLRKTLNNLVNVHNRIGIKAVECK